MGLCLGNVWFESWFETSSILTDGFWCFVSVVQVAAFDVMVEVAARQLRK